MLETILAISGKPGLFKLVSRGNRSLIVETLDAQKKRFPAFGADKVISLADIAMYTDEKEVPLREVLNNIKAKESGKTASIDWRKASKDELFAYLGELFAYVSVVVNGGAVGLTSAHGRRVENSLLIISLSFPEMGGNRA